MSRSLKKGPYVDPKLYKKVQATGMGYNQALTEVKRGFINGDYDEQWQAPYYWAPFVFYGK